MEHIILRPIKICLGIVLTPILVGLLLVHGLISDTPKMIEYIKYKTDTKFKYVKYDDIPYFLRPDYLYYNSYKDKIAVIVNDKMYFAHKYINKSTNKIVYIDDNGMVIDSNIEQYKIGVLNVEKCKK